MICISKTVWLLGFISIWVLFVELWNFLSLTHIGTCSYILNKVKQHKGLSDVALRFVLASSYCSWVSLLNCCIEGGNWVPFFRGLPLGFGIIPANCFRWLALYLVMKLCICLYVNPIFSPIARRCNLVILILIFLFRNFEYDSILLAYKIPLW